MSRPLAGIKVLELATYVAAPTCARLLADLGADVIKIEHPNGDAWRQTGKSYVPSRFSDDENPVFDIYNSGKRHIALNLKSPEGMEACHKLLAETDIFITNTRVPALKRLGLSYEDLKERYPRLIYACILGYGENGPDAEMPAFDTTAYWSRTGFLRDMAVIGSDYCPVGAPSSVGDSVSGMFLMGEICAALYNRTITGKGDYVRSGLYHNGIFTMGTMAIINQKPFGVRYPKNRLDYGVPGGSYECADGEWVFIAVAYAPVVIPRLCNAIGRPDLIEDPRLSTASGRWEHRAENYKIFREAFLSKTSTEWVEIAAKWDLPLMKMNHFSDVSEDEQAWANDYLEHVEFANGNVDVMPSSPIEMDSVGALKTTPAPGIGADTAEVLLELGYSDVQIAEMGRSGAVSIGSRKK